MGTPRANPSFLFSVCRHATAVLPQSLGEPTTLSWITNDFGSTLGFGSSILLAFLIGFHARVRFAGFAMQYHPTWEFRSTYRRV